MGETSRNVDMEELITYSNNLVQILKSDKDISAVKQFLQKSQSLQSQTDKDFYQVQKSIQEYEKKIDACKQKAAAAAKLKAAADEELDLLQKELEEEEKEEHMLKDEFRVVVSEIDDLERQMDSIEEGRKNLKKLEQDELRAQMKLSMFASVTNIIPNLDDPSKISGHIVDRDTKAVEIFEFDPTKLTAFDTCNGIWKMINS